MSEAAENEAERRATWQEFAEWNWVEVAGAGNGLLHAVGALSADAAAECDWGGDGVTECGRHGDLRIPGLFTRMSAQRCDECCEKTGMPRGEQSPKNIEECRVVVEARIAALHRVD